MQHRDAETLLEAHVTHELNRFQGEPLKDAIKEEVSAFYEWGGEITLNDLTNPEDIFNVIRRNIIEKPIPEAVIAMITEDAIKVHEVLQASDALTEEILPKEHYDLFVEHIIGLEDLRHEITRQSVNTSIYAKLISHVLYDGIKSFVVSENAVTKKVPGASSLLKFGKGVLSIAAPMLEDSIDTTLRDFIKVNIETSIKGSEKFLNSALNEELLNQLASEIWEAIEKEKINVSTQYIDADFITSLSPVVCGFWEHFRSTPFFTDTCKELIDYFFEKHADKKVTLLLEDVGVTEDVAIQEACETACPIFEKPVIRKYLEQRLRARLESFYLKAE